MMGTKRKFLSICATVFVVCVAAFAQSQREEKPATPPAPPASLAIESTPPDFRAAARALREGQREQALVLLQQAAERGQIFAQWKLASLYAAGDQIAKNEHMAFDLFQQIIDKNGDISARAPTARLVSNAYVMLSKYHRSGVLAPRIPKNPQKARDLLTYAASYFGDPDAQYLLGKMYIEGEGGEKNSLTALRWLKLSAKNGNVFAQTTFGHLLFNGMEQFKPDRVQGLAWMTIAHEALRTRPHMAETHPNIVSNYEWASALATADEKLAAERILQRLR